MKHTLTEIVKKGVAKLDYVANGVVVYNISVDDTIYQLSINTTQDDAKDATFNLVEKAIYFMRWVRKAIKDNTLIQLTQN